MLQGIHDLCCDDHKIAQEAINYVNSDIIHSHIVESGYPMELREALVEVADLSLYQRKVTCKEIIQVLKKTPVKVPGQTDRKITGRDNQ